MADFFDRLKEGIDKVSIKAKETIEVTKIKGQISKIQELKRRAFEDLGAMTYEMIISENMEIEKLKERAEEIKELDKQIKQKEKELIEIQTKTQQELEGLKLQSKCECGAIIHEGFKFCVKCGKKIEIKEEKIIDSEQKEKTLPHCECGDVISPGAKFCKKCGRSLI